ncbi:hypothetical protein E3P92_03770 [Wallemia ichthyophaga]|uniref:Ribosomal RNA-processing protein 14 n=2 Tax=Wallemia ichthyophaga TaxID=245174 RepID=A0A4T0IQ58_WALIC|nr:Ribosomal RNA-processing protein 14 [Wallemia ichthyophaga EXF-994]TIA95321.1 hypothetical protein E3P95_03762 [Wallemia ichthyophaga]EOR03769.1 Ribosomal RNA-processing protein 14 [Wallemia ichthyophaga EXF-994]TIA96277.1 hypothetical protein E3P94_03767 [Wallemia ichthyophaga]TIB07774.1 hypothetical protein E3P93_03752 [Wallemia ichthyophaga]TIB08229.1 hypothetical protein E3P90_03752 [Wallemia ichthyophaga]
MDAAKLNDKFEFLLNLIPTQFYFSQEAATVNKKYFKQSSNKNKLQAKLARVEEAAPRAQDIDDSASLQDLATDSTTQSPLPLPLPSQSTHSQLKSKLTNKLTQFEHKRNVDHSLSSKESLLENRRQRNLKKDKKEKKSDVKQLKQAQQTQQPQKGDEEDDKSSSSLQFSSLQNINKSPKQPKQPSNPKQALQKLEAAKQKNTELDADTKAAKEDDSLWKSASAKAQGVKLNDDEAKLKKQIKRNTKQKAKSATNWNDRKKNLEKSMATAHKKRSDNIANRKSAGKSGKGGKSGDKKGGAKRAGFEGKISNKKKTGGGASKSK